MPKSKYATRMGIRARKVGPETQKHLGQVGSTLYKEYKAALQEEIYDRTPRPVTRKLLNSVVIQFLGRAVQVSNSLAAAPYVCFRRAATGTGNYKGRTWKKDTQWDETARERAWPRIKELTRGMHRRIIGGN